MKYEKEYQVSNDREHFILLLHKNHKLKRTTALRRWYDYYKKSKINEDILPVGIDPHDIKELRYAKKIELRDMLKFKMPLTDINLKRYGFHFEEINWIKMNKGKLNGI